MRRALSRTLTSTKPGPLSVGFPSGRVPPSFSTPWTGRADSSLKSHVDVKVGSAVFWRPLVSNGEEQVMATFTQAAEIPASADRKSVHYKWIALSNTTLGILMVTINQSILLISLPDIFRGITLNPLAPANI